MKLIVGLGNPGKQYERTRHNVGFMVVEILSDELSIPVERIRFKGLLGEGREGSEKVALLKPATYMNLSGESVLEAVQFYKLSPQDVLVIYDDMDLPAGQMRIRKSGGHGGHNGMRNIIQLLGTDDFPRIRVGIGKAPYEGADHVLGAFRKEEQEVMFEAFVKAAKAARMFLTEPIDIVMNRCNERPPKPKKVKPEKPVEAVETPAAENAPEKME